MEEEKFERNLEAEDSNSTVKKSFGKCPKCGKDVIEYPWGWGCINDKVECGLTISNVKSGVVITEEMVSLLLLNNEIGPYEFTSREGKVFKAKLKVDIETGKLKLVFDDMELKETDFVCPGCGKNLKKTSYSYQCDCGFFLSKKIRSHELTEKEMGDLLCGGTDLIEDFVSKAGKPFKARLRLNANKIDFVF